MICPTCGFEAEQFEPCGYDLEVTTCGECGQTTKYIQCDKPLCPACNACTSVRFEGAELENRKSRRVAYESDFKRQDGKTMNHKALNLKKHELIELLRCIRKDIILDEYGWGNGRFSSELMAAIDSALNPSPKPSTP